MARDRVTITDLHSFGLVDEADSLNVKENALTRCMNLKFKHGRLVPCTNLGTKIGTSLYGTTSYNAGKTWSLLNAQNVYVSGSDKTEYHWYDAETSTWKKYPLPDWFGGFAKISAKVSTTCELHGDDLGGTYGTGYTLWNTDAGNPAKYLMPQTDTYEKDVIFFGKLTAAGMDIDEAFPFGGSMSNWTTVSGTPNIVASSMVTDGWAYHTTTLKSMQNRFFTVRKVYCNAVIGESHSAGMFFFDSTTGLGYAVLIAYKMAADYPATTHTEYRLRVYCGYFGGETTYAGTTGMLNSSLLILDETVETVGGTATAEDFTKYNDIFAFIQGPWLNVGYGRTIVAAIPIEVNWTGHEVRFGFITDGDSYIGPANAEWNCISTGTLTISGPYYVTKVVTSTSDPSLFFTSDTLLANDRGIVWGCHSTDETNLALRPSTEYLLRQTSDEPLKLYYGGLMPGIVPNQGQPTDYPAFVGWGGNDVCIFNGRIFLAGVRLYTNVIVPTDGSGNSYYRWREIAGYPTRIAWNTPYDAEDWTDAILAGWVENVDSSGWVTAIRPMRDVLMAYKSDSIFRLTPTGESANPFSITTYSRTMGVPRARAIGDVGMEHYFTWNEQLWQANLGDLQQVQTMVSIDSDYILALPYDHTVICGKSCTSGSPGKSGNATGLEGLAYNYKLGATYEIDMAYLRDIDVVGDDWMAVALNGDVYHSDVAVLPTSDLTGDAMYFTTPNLAFGDPFTNKTLYTVDVIFKIPNTYHTYDLTWTLGPITTDIYCQSTSIGRYTPTPELIGYGSDGYDLYRSRHTLCCTGLTFQIKVEVGKGNWSSTTTGEHPVTTILQSFGAEIVRLEMEIEREENDQKASAL